MLERSVERCVAAELRRVLVADDETTFCDVLAAFLRSAGYAVVVVYDGVQALEALARGRFDAIVADQWMPQVDGLSVLRKARALQPQARQVLMSSLFVSQDTAAGLPSVDLVLTKPFAICELVRTLGGWLAEGALNGGSDGS